MGLLFLGAAPLTAQVASPEERVRRYLAEAPEDRERAAAALARGGQELVPVLVSQLRHALGQAADEERRLAALEAAATDDSEDEITERRAALDEAIERAAALCLALERIAAPAALPVLCEALASSSAALADAAARAIQAVDSPRRLELLAGAFRAKPSKRIATTIGALHDALGAGPCLATLERLYERGADAEARSAVLAGIAQVEAPASRELLRRLATLGDSLALAALARYLATPDGAPELQVLSDALISGEPWAQATAAAALGRAAAWALPAIAPRLIEALEGGDARVARHAAASLEALTGQRLGRDAAAWYGWWARARETAGEEEAR